MDAEIETGNNAKFNYKETHYYGEFSGIEVIPKARVTLGEKALYENTRMHPARTGLRDKL